jgi:hypothetical protein
MHVVRTERASQRWAKYDLRHPSPSPWYRFTASSPPLVASAANDDDDDEEEEGKWRRRRRRQSCGSAAKA